MNKKLIAILTLVMFAMTLLPMGAFALTKNQTSGAIKTITGTGNTELATIVLQDDAIGGKSFTDGGTISLVLPAGVEWQAGFNTTAVAGSPTAANHIGFTKVGAMDEANVLASAPAGQRLNLTFDANSVKGDTIEIRTMVNVITVGTGDITVDIESINTGVNTGSLVVGKFSGKNLTANMMTAPTVGTGDVQAGVISFKENAANVWDNTAADQIKLRLPNNFAWDVAAMNALYGGAANVKMTNGDLVVLALGATERDLTVTRSGATASAAIFDLKTAITVKSDAAPGEIEVSISGAVSETLVIATYKDYGVSITAAKAKELVAGRNDQEIAQITIKEDVKGSIVPARPIRFTLPEGMVFTTGSTPKINVRAGAPINGGAGNFDTVTLGALSADKTSIEFNIGDANTPFSTSKLEFRLEDVKVNVKSSAPTGDVTVKIDGIAGVKGDVVVANVIKPITVTTDAADILIGTQGQALNDILIKEMKKEGIRLNAMVGTIPANTLVLETPASATWAATPKVEVVEGDLLVKEVTRASNNTQIRILIEGESTKAAVIKVSGAKITTNRTIPEGDLFVDVKGPVISDSATDAALMSVKVAVVVTPAGENVVKPVTMTVGSTIYTIDGVENDMDVAPYIKSDRTYFPVRYVANALGINDENVVWDPAQRTVTIFRANRIVQVAIGSTTMLVNGVPVTMDVAPEITAERTMLPIRFVAQGLGVNVIWDAATQTVTLN